MPGLFCFIYTFAFLLDTLNAFGTIALNNVSAEEAKTEYALYEVEKQMDGMNLIKAGHPFDIVPLEDGLVCEILVDSRGYHLHAQGHDTITPKLDFIEYDTEQDLYFINGAEEGKVEPSDKVLCKVYYKDEQFYINDGDKDSKLDITLNFKYDAKNNVVTVNPYYTIAEETTNTTYFVSNLDKDMLYYDSIEGIYVRNVGKDFLKNFLIGTNVLLFSLIVILYVTALIYANKHFKIEYFASKPVIAVNIVGMTALILGLLLAIILLS